METLLFVLVVASLLWLGMEDFRFRHISLVPLLVLVGSAVGYRYSVVGLNLLLVDMLLNLAFFAVQLLLLTIYFSIKHRRWTNLIDRQFGLGDVLFLIPLAVLLPFPRSVWFYMVALVVILLGHFLYYRSRVGEATVPLAGGLAMLLAGYLVGLVVF